MQDNVLEYLFPELGDVIVRNGDPYEAGIHHLEDVLGFEYLGSGPNLHRCLANLDQVGIDLLQALVEAR